LLSPAQFRDLASGKRRGVWPSLLRGGLRLAEIPYALYIWRRNRRYDSGKSKIERAEVPVVSIGNLTVGGTGKTPFVEWLARWFRTQGKRVTILSRGYGAEAGARNDEALELEQNLPDVPHLQNPDRVEGARVAIEEFECDLILLDDGFQHRRLHRDLDIVLLDALEPFGYGHLLPRGLLREPLSSLARAQVICLSRADLVDQTERDAVREQVRKHAPSAVWVELAHRPLSLLSSTGEQASVESLRGRNIAAFCGIGNPDGFRKSLEACRYKITEWREFPDHHRYSREDVARLADWANAASAEAVVCTQKDLVKLQVTRLGELPLWALRIGIEVLAGQPEMEAILKRFL
jgi:tetraacyldisaccharide 4'-kinase